MPTTGNTSAADAEAATDQPEPGAAADKPADKAEPKAAVMDKHAPGAAADKPADKAEPKAAVMDKHAPGAATDKPADKAEPKAAVMDKHAPGAATDKPEPAPAATDEHAPKTEPKAAVTDKPAPGATTDKPEAAPAATDKAEPGAPAMDKPEPAPAATDQPGVAETEAATGLSSRARLVLVTLSALVLVSAALVGWAGWQALSTARARSTQDQALAAARTATTQVLSYSPPTLDADLARSRSMISGVFAGKFAQLADNVIVPVVKQQDLTTKATVVRAAVIDAQPHQVRALLFVNQRSTAPGRPEPNNTANQVRVTMTSVEGRWLISDLEPL